jgi:hypothetical protein
MPAKADRILDRLFERNPNLDPKNLIAAFKEQAAENPELTGELAEYFTERLLPILEKRNAGKSLSEGERAFLKMNRHERLTEAERAAAAAHDHSLHKQ